MAKERQRDRRKGQRGKKGSGRQGKKGKKFSRDSLVLTTGDLVSDKGDCTDECAMLLFLIMFALFIGFFVFLQSFKNLQEMRQYFSEKISSFTDRAPERK